MSSIRMSSGFGSSGQKRTSEKVVIEPLESIHQKNHTGYTRHNSPCCRFSRRTQEPRLLGRPKGVVSAAVAAAPPGRDWPRLRGDSTPRATETALAEGKGPASFSTPPGEKGSRSTAEWSAPLETKFLLFWAGQERDSVLLRSPAPRSPTARVFGVAPGQRPVPPPTWPELA